MLLAAGLGTRMDSIGADLAKPALPILDEPLVLRLVRTLANEGIQEVVVNTHAHPDSIRAALGESPLPLIFSHEPELCGSGGGILNARKWLDGDEPFLVLNADMVIDLNLSTLLKAHQRHGAIATLVLRDDARKERFGHLGYDNHGVISRVTDLVRVGPESGSALFTGVHVLEPAIFDRMPRGRRFEVFVDVYVPLLREGERLGAWLQPEEARWSPVGTPEELLDANLRALGERLGGGEDALHLEEGARVEGEIVGPTWVGRGAQVEAGARVGPWTVLGGGSCVESDASLERTVLLPGARVPTRNRLVEAIIGREIWRRG